MHNIRMEFLSVCWITSDDVRCN